MVNGWDMFLRLVTIFMPSELIDNRLRFYFFVPTRSSYWLLNADTTFQVEEKNRDITVGVALENCLLLVDRLEGPGLTVLWARTVYLKVTVHLFVGLSWKFRDTGIRCQALHFL